MPFESFELFAEIISKLPERAIIGALELGGKILTENISRYRKSFTPDAYSVLCFRKFVRSARLGEAIHYIRFLPPDHIEIYKKTVVRLVQAGELAASAMEQFDGAFAVERYS